MLKDNHALLHETLLVLLKTHCNNNSLFNTNVTSCLFPNDINESTSVILTSLLLIPVIPLNLALSGRRILNVTFSAYALSNFGIVNVALFSCLCDGDDVNEIVNSVFHPLNKGYLGSASTVIFSSKRCVSYVAI